MAETSAAALAAALGGYREGSGWLARCPVPGHRDAHPSFYIEERDGKLLWVCRGKCSPGATTAALLKAGLIGRRAEAPSSAQEPEVQPQWSKTPCDPLKPLRGAMPFWRDCLADLYLRWRAIELFEDEAASLLFAPRLYHWPSGQWFGAMLAPVKSADGRIVGLHQTFISANGRKAQIERSKLFSRGSAPSGAGVFFGSIDAQHEVVIAEGIESTLSGMRLLDARAGVAGLSASGIRELILPDTAKRVVVFADRDPGGQGLVAARAAWARWKAEGREVRVVAPTTTGEDANDILRRRAHG